MLYIKVPATSANIGPGFDTLGLALNLYHEIGITKLETFEEIVEWPDGAILLDKSENLVISGIDAVFSHYNLPKVGYYLKMIRCDIPISRGLGSSAAAYVSGVAAGLHLAGLPIEKELICEISTALEGHPDNVTPAVFGGLTASCTNSGKVLHQSINLSKPLSFIALIPEKKLSTELARSVLPQHYNKQDVVFNLGRLSLLLSALSNGDYSVLKTATQDLLHQPQRLELLPDFELLRQLSDLSSVLGSFISGAGSTYMLLCHPSAAAHCISEAKHVLSKGHVPWRVELLDLESGGMQWEISA